MNKPVIGIISSSMYFPANNFDNVDKVYVNQAYITAIEKNGGTPLIIPPLMEGDSLDNLLGLCRGLLFPGGEDVDPALYGEEPSPKLGVFRPEMDRFALAAAEFALSRYMPVFGICRGMQLLNVAKGGSLFQDLSLRELPNILHYQSYSRSYLAHSLKITRGTNLCGIFGQTEIKVNTMHHQSVNRLGRGLKASAFATDGVVEALENEGGSIMAVQWHPEELLQTAPIMNGLFAFFIEKAREF